MAGIVTTRGGHRARDNIAMSLSIECAGESLCLLPERAVWWPRTRTLLAADVHLGKAAALRRRGVAVPSGSSAADLERLSTLVTTHGALRLLLLGDVFHAAPEPDEPVMTAFDTFRARHDGLHIQITAGNHDRPAQFPTRWQLDWCEGAVVDAPFVMQHMPQPDPRGYVLCGHLHPAQVLRTARERARLPVFWMGHSVGVLPAFGQLTGGYEITPGLGDRLFGVLPEGVAALPTPRARSARTA